MFWFKNSITIVLPYHNQQASRELPDTVDKILVQNQKLGEQIVSYF